MEAIHKKVGGSLNKHKKIKYRINIIMNAIDAVDFIIIYPCSSAFICGCLYNDLSVFIRVHLWLHLMSIICVHLRLLL